MHLLADTLEARIGPHGVERRRHIRLGKIGEAGDRIRKTVRVCSRLYPRDLLDAARRVPIGLNIDRGDNAIVFDVGKIFGDRR